MRSASSATSLEDRMPDVHCASVVDNLRRCSRARAVVHETTRPDSHRGTCQFRGGGGAGSPATPPPTVPPTRTTFFVTGRVLENDHPNAPIPGATVSVGSGPNVRKSATTDSSEGYTLTGLEPDPARLFVLQVTANGHRKGEVLVRRFSNRTNLDCYLRRRLSVTNISPTPGPPSGGTLVTITGVGFPAGAIVTMGVRAKGVRVISNRSITAIGLRRNLACPY
jgi:hypothetical protein